MKYPSSIVRSSTVATLLLATVMILSGAPSTPIPAPFSDPGPIVGDTMDETVQKNLRAVRMQEGAPAWLPTVVTAATTPVMYNGRAGRRGVSVYNQDSSITVYLGADNTVNASSVNAFPLGPGQSVPIDTTAAIYVYAATGSPKVVFIETYTPPLPSAAVTVLPPQVP